MSFYTPFKSLMLVLLAAAFAPAATSVSQFGITWTFDKDYPTGRYASGDYWVIGPVKITEISPAAKKVGERQMNGTMINPVAGMQAKQGWDSDAQNKTYDEKLNLSLTLPLDVPAGSSVMSSSSVEQLDEGIHAPRIDMVAVLTVVAAEPAKGAFRPPYCGTDKSGDWNESKLNYGLLKKLKPVAETPDIGTYAKHFERPWIEVNTSTGGRYLHPKSTQPGYGRDLSYQLQNGLLMLHLDYTNEQKRDLYVRLVQFGIDVYGAAKSGGYWADLGGFNMGRKMPMILAGLALDDKNILKYANAKSAEPKGFIFQEDLQTWYVTKEDVGRPLYQVDKRPREAYIEADVGLAEWGEQHTKQPVRDGRNWSAYYREICYASMMGHALAARLTPGAVEAWNWPAFFDYIDRAEKDSDMKAPKFVENMWAAYRKDAADAR